jgi:hypothetical protein
VIESLFCLKDKCSQGLRDPEDLVADIDFAIRRHHLKAHRGGHLVEYGMDDDRLFQTPMPKG